jgi:DNA-binding response OmpR family regulator
VEEPVYLQDGGLIQVALVQNFVYLSSDATIPLGPGVSAAQPENGRLFLDVRSRRVWVKDLEIVPPLSVPQFRLLYILYQNRGQVVSRDNLVAAVWGDEEAEGVSEEAVDALVRRLRDRLAAIDPQHAFIITVRGHGLRLDNEEG